MIILKGKIELTYSDFYESIKLVQDNGYKIDLVSRFREYVDSYRCTYIEVFYYISYREYTYRKLIDSFSKKIHGYVDASYEKISFSNHTYEDEYETTLKIGEHDFFKELSNNEGKFIFIQIK